MDILLDMGWRGATESPRGGGNRATASDNALGAVAMVLVHANRVAVPSRRAPRLLAARGRGILPRERHHLPRRPRAVIASTQPWTSSPPAPSRSRRWSGSRGPARARSRSSARRRTSLAPGECRSPASRSPRGGGSHWNDDPARSLHFASRPRALQAAAPRSILVGLAFAPRRAAGGGGDARLRWVNLDKAVEVHADRTFAQEGQLREGSRFTQMPLVYERAAGGPGTWNPVGVRADAAPTLGARRSCRTSRRRGATCRRRASSSSPSASAPSRPPGRGGAPKLWHHAATFSARTWNSGRCPRDGPGVTSTPRRPTSRCAPSPERSASCSRTSTPNSRARDSLPGDSPRARVEGAARALAQCRCAPTRS